MTAVLDPVTTASSNSLWIDRPRPENNLTVSTRFRPENQNLSFAPMVAFLRGRIAPGWDVRQHLPLAIEQDEDGTFMVSDSVFAIYGTGETPTAALADFVSALIGYYELLQARALEHEPTRRLFATLQTYIQPA